MPESKNANSGLKMRIRIMIIMAVAVAAVLAIRLQDKAGSESAAAESVAAKSAVTESVAAAAFPGSGETPVLLDLGADKCVPCKMMMPILDEMRETYAGSLEVIFIDVWKDGEAGKKYGIKSIPTQIFFTADGAELYRHQGFYPREDILAKWSELGYEFES